MNLNVAEAEVRVIAFIQISSFDIIFVKANMYSM